MDLESEGEEPDAGSGGVGLSSIDKKPPSSTAGVVDPSQLLPPCSPPLLPPPPPVSSDAVGKYSNKTKTFLFSILKFWKWRRPGDVTCVRKRNFQRGSARQLPVVGWWWCRPFSSSFSSSFTGFSVCPVVYDGRLIAHKGAWVVDRWETAAAAAAAPALLCTIAFNILQRVENLFLFLFPFISGFSKKIKVGATGGVVTAGLSISQTKIRPTTNPGQSVPWKKKTRKGKGSCEGLRVELWLDSRDVLGSHFCVPSTSREKRLHKVDNNFPPSFVYHPHGRE